MWTVFTLAYPGMADRHKCYFYILRQHLHSVKMLVSTNLAQMVVSSDKDRNHDISKDLQVQEEFLQHRFDTQCYLTLLIKFENLLNLK